MEVIFRPALIQVDHVFAAVRRIAYQTLTDGIDDKIEQLQGHLSDQHGAILGHLGDVDRAIAVLHGETDGATNLDFDVAGRGPRP